ncbi:ATP-grasp domain-containing protein [Streptomyces durbertensis]|uniref:ATP-grasp domain-containing protein n=1 Tax=Streptomyces durbertensis TaxID=2448886 RepID=A0ABR6EK06_9ACTN|nr:ATP-grasp domain-containing protein [Streptomyces durbertensis]MBB1245673.1 ATP-grasp domain-containing protein [Streptomyces durbertensis]
MRQQDSPAPRVLVIAGRAGKLKAAVDAGFEVVYAQHTGLFTDHHRAVSHEALLLDYTRPDLLLPVAAGLHQAAPLALVASFTDPGLEPAGLLTEHLGLPGNPASVSTLFRDKYALRSRLAEAGVETHPGALVNTTAELRVFCENHGYPVVLKPRDGTGSENVRRIDSYEDVERAFDGCAEEQQPLLAERFLVGKEISVETVSQHGRHCVLALTEKFIDETFVECGHVIPARIGPEHRPAVEKLVMGLLDAAGLVEGCAHTEVMLTDTGPVSIESHNRMGGDRIYELVRLSYGTDLERLGFTLPLGIDPLPEPPAPTRAAAIWFVRAEPGRVVEVVGREQAEKAEGVHEVVVNAEPGSVVQPVRSSADRVGYVIATGENSDSAVERARAAAEEVRVRTEPAATEAHTG